MVSPKVQYFGYGEYGQSAVKKAKGQVVVLRIYIAAMATRLDEVFPKCHPTRGGYGTFAVYFLPVPPGSDNLIQPMGVALIARPKGKLIGKVGYQGGTDVPWAGFEQRLPQGFQFVGGHIVVGVHTGDEGTRSGLYGDAQSGYNSFFPTAEYSYTRVAPGVFFEERAGVVCGLVVYGE
jgi:hypothetical protein